MEARRPEAGPAGGVGRRTQDGTGGARLHGKLSIADGGEERREGRQEVREDDAGARVLARGDACGVGGRAAGRSGSLGGRTGAGPQGTWVHSTLPRGCRACEDEDAGSDDCCRGRAGGDRFGSGVNALGRGPTSAGRRAEARSLLGPCRTSDAQKHEICRAQDLEGRDKEMNGSEASEVERSCRMTFGTPSSARCRCWRSGRPRSSSSSAAMCARCDVSVFNSLVSRRAWAWTLSVAV